MRSWAYDDAGNRTEAESVTSGTPASSSETTYNALNQITTLTPGSGPAETFSYDDAGQMTGVSTSAGSLSISWDPLGEMTGIDQTGFGAGDATYTYDALGRRAARDDGSALTEAHYGDTSDLETLRTDASANPLSSYLSGPAGLLESSDATTTTYSLRDARGDIRTETDDLGAMSATHDPLPFGEADDGFVFLGAQQRRSEDGGFVAMGARVYAPGLGVFLSEDPVLGVVGSGQAWNRGAYARDNPVTMTDLDGRNPCDLPVVAGACRAPAALGSGADWIGDRISDLRKEIAPPGECTTYTGFFHNELGIDVGVEYDDNGVGLTAGAGLGLAPILQ